MDDSTSRFWDNYISKTITCNIPGKAQRWYVKHVEAYIKAHRGRRLTDTGPDDIACYLDEIGRKPDFPDWRFRQIADALRILHTEIIKPKWAEEFNWHTWAHDDRELGREHATLARISDAGIPGGIPILIAD